VLQPRIGVTDRPARPPATGSERDAFMKAIEGLEEHLALDPTNGGAAWLLGKALLVLDRRADAYAVWTHALEQASNNQEIGRDFSLELLQENRIDEAGAIARKIANQHPDDATLWCNLAVTEILSGRLAGAEIALGRSLKLTPDDPIARHVQTRLLRYQAGATLPRSLAELSRG
jgi:cytochrome c-type biogenesis protein CcmH/NrfG